MLYLAFLLLLSSCLVSADDGCYSSVDTSVFKGSQQYGTQDSCSTSCGSSYPYVAMKNGGDCYCLSALPSSSSSTSSSSCSVKCNGYGSQMCGGTDAYTVFDNKNYSGSPVVSSSSSQSSSRSSSASSSQTSSSGSSSSSSSSSSSKPTSSSSSSSSGGSSSSPSTTQGASSSVITTTLTSGGSSSVQYKTVTASSDPTSSPSPSASSSSQPSSKSSSNVGPIVGGVVGGVAALAIGVAIIFFLVRRKAADDDDEKEYFKKGSAGSTGSGGVSRARSNKINSVFDMPMANPFEHPSDDLAEKRASTAATGELTDPRLNPVMMGRRRLSEGSLADEADYSRKILGVANP